MQFICGDKFQQLADVSILTNTDNSYRSGIIQNQLKNINVEICVFNEQQPIIVSDKVKYAKKIFVYTDVLDFFFKNILPHIETNFILISHNGDAPINADHEKYLNSNKIKKWYCQNASFKHEKVIPIPIGIANKQWEHGNEEVFRTNYQEIKSLDKIFVCFNLNTNLSFRTQIMEICRFSKICDVYSSLNFKDFNKIMSNYKYTVCPIGNFAAGTAGDNHRVYESLYVGNIPIVFENQKIIYDNIYKDLPIILLEDLRILNDKEKLDIEFLKIKDKSKEKIDFNYWKNIINNDL